MNKRNIKRISKLEESGIIIFEMEGFYETIF